MRKLDQILGNNLVSSAIIAAHLLSVLALYVAMFVYLFQRPILQNDYFKVAVVSSVTFFFNLIIFYMTQKELIKSVDINFNKIASTLSMLATIVAFELSSGFFLCAFGVFH